MMGKLSSGIICAVMMNVSTAQAGAGLAPELSPHFSGYGPHGIAVATLDQSIPVVARHDRPTAVHFSGVGPHGTDFDVHMANSAYVVDEVPVRIESQEQDSGLSLHFSGYGPHPPALM